MSRASLLALLALANLALWLARNAARAFDKSALANRRAAALVVLGSGGHTAEMLNILSNARVSRRLRVAAYVVASTDARSAEKARAFERARRGDDGDGADDRPRARGGAGVDDERGDDGARVRAGARDRRARRAGRGDLQRTGDVRADRARGDGAPGAGMANAGDGVRGERVSRAHAQPDGEDFLSPAVRRSGVRDVGGRARAVSSRDVRRARDVARVVIERRDAASGSGTRRGVPLGTRRAPHTRARRLDAPEFAARRGRTSARATRDARPGARARDANAASRTRRREREEMSADANALGRATSQRLTRSSMPLMLFYCTEVRGARPRDGAKRSEREGERRRRRIQTRRLTTRGTKRTDGTNGERDRGDRWKHRVG